MHEFKSKLQEFRHLLKKKQVLYPFEYVRGMNTVYSLNMNSRYELHCILKSSNLVAFV